VEISPRQSDAVISPLAVLLSSLFITLIEVYDKLEVKPRPRLQVVKNNLSKSM